jgi:hypothetical protein
MNGSGTGGTAGEGGFSSTCETGGTVGGGAAGFGGAIWAGPGAAGLGGGTNGCGAAAATGFGAGGGAGVAGAAAVTNFLAGPLAVGLRAGDVAAWGFLAGAVAIAFLAVGLRAGDSAGLAFLAITSWRLVCVPEIWRFWPSWPAPWPGRASQQSCWPTSSRQISSPVFLLQRLSSFPSPLSSSSSP